MSSTIFKILNAVFLFVLLFQVVAPTQCGLFKTCSEEEFCKKFLVLGIECFPKLGEGEKCGRPEECAEGLECVDNVCVRSDLTTLTTAGTEGPDERDDIPTTLME